MIDFHAELTAAGAHVSSRWGALRFFIRRYPLGAAGAVIMLVFLFAAAFAPYITVYDPLTTNAAASLARPSASHWLEIGRASCRERVQIFEGGPAFKKRTNIHMRI